MSLLTLVNVLQKLGSGKTELSKLDMIKLLTCLEGELQARDIVIATLKMEKVKHAVKLQQQGRLSRLGAVGDPFAALQRDSTYAVINLFLCFGSDDKPRRKTRPFATSCTLSTKASIDTMHTCF
jgi:hypothetical protein